MNHETHERNHETHEMDEGRERFSCISCPFVSFVFQTAIHKSEHLRAQQREAERQAEHLFRTLLHRAFRGKLGDPKGLGDP